MSSRDDLLAIYAAALTAVEGQQVVKRSLADLKYQHDCHLIAIGKAAESMSVGAIEQLGNAIQSGLIITKQGHFTTALTSNNLTSNKRFKCIEASHPVPDWSSLQAGEQLVHYLQQLPQQAHCLLLISGGASSLVEVLRPDWTLAELQALTHHLLAKGYPIDEINAVRRHVSRIKAGGLWSYLQNKQVTCLMISDVADNDPAIIGSGLLFPSSSVIPSTLPSKWRSRFKALPDINAPNFTWDVIAILDDAKQAAALAAVALGYRVNIDPIFLKGDAIDMAKYCVRQLQQSTANMMIWGGETTVNLPNNAPIGGRNQHFALAVAIELSTSGGAFLCIGTDGSDGSSSAAGAFVDAETIQQGRLHELSAEEYLQQANAHAFLTATGGLVTTGATGTNVMDLVLGIKKNN
jgi:hydroxypyruvate reductase